MRMMRSATPLSSLPSMVVAKNQVDIYPGFLFLVQQVGCIAIFQLAQPEQAELPHHLHPFSTAAGERPEGTAIRVTTSFGVVSL